MIVAAPEKELVLPSVDATFTLKDDDLAQTLKTAAVLQSPHIAFESDGSKITVTTFDAINDSAHTNSVVIVEGEFKEFKAVFLAENWKMIPGTYEIQISFKGLASFKNKNGNIDYFIAIDAKHSKYGA